MSKTSLEASGTAGRILDVAEQLAQTRGYNGFSYADVAAEVGVTKASLHYHFPSKAILGQTLVARYASRFALTLQEIAALEVGATEKFRRYINLYGETLRRERMCLCGILAAEWDTLPASIQDEIRAFFVANEEWLTTLLTLGRSSGAFAFDAHPRELAALATATLEGAMLLARSGPELDRFERVAEHLLRSIVPA